MNCTTNEVKSNVYHDKQKNIASSRFSGWKIMINTCALKVTCHISLVVPTNLHCVPIFSAC